MKEYIKERNEAFTAFILTGNKKPVIKYCKKYKVHMPKDERIFAAGVYKAALNCMGIEKYVKDLAFRKCIELGFSPYIDDDYEYLNDR